MPRPRKHPVKTVAAVERALRVLDVFRKGRSSLSLAEIVSATGLLKTTVFRLLLTLENTGYLVRLPDGRFQLGAVFMQFGAAYREAFRLQDHILPVMQRLAEITGESASFYVREGEQRLCLLRVDSKQPVRDVVPPGTILPIDDTAASQILREYRDVKNPSAFIEKDCCELIKATVGKGTTPQVASVSAPVFGVDGLLGALSLSGPRERFSRDATATMKRHLGSEVAKLNERLCGVCNLPPPADDADGDEDD